VIGGVHKKKEEKEIRLREVISQIKQDQFEHYQKRQDLRSMRQEEVVESQRKREQSFEQRKLQ
jgi:hypothetical protein